jgi:hypothetical protein
VSPWTHDEHTDAFQALRFIYPPDEVKSIFASGEAFPWLASILVDPWRPDLSALLALGFDAAHARIDRWPELARRLRDRSAYAGARLELGVLAGLARAQLPFHYEPYAAESRRRASRGESFPNPDIKVQLGFWVCGDIKKMQVSERSRRRQLRLHTLLNGRTQDLAPLGAAIELTDRYARLEHSHYSEDRLDRLALTLRDLAMRKVEEMRARGLVRGTVGGGLVSLDLSHRQSSGIPLDDPRDANRVVSKLDEGAAQIPNGERGLIFVEPSEADAIHLVYAAAAEWLALAKPEVLGVILIGEQWVSNTAGCLRVPVPVWRSSTPRKLRREEQWKRFAAGLNWRWLRTASFRNSSSL